MTAAELQALATRLLQEADAREARLLVNALECERAGDQEGAWFAMAARAENDRFRDRLRRDLGLPPRGTP